MSPKLLRRMQSSAAYRVNVCMVIYPPRSQNLHPVWPTYRELWPQPCHTTARRLRETYKEIGASPSPSAATNARLCLKVRNKHRFRVEAKIFVAAVTLDSVCLQCSIERSEIKYNTNDDTVVAHQKYHSFFIGYIGEYICIRERKHFWF